MGECTVKVDDEFGEMGALLLGDDDFGDLLGDGAG